MAARRILVVNGDYDACDSTVEALKGCGYQVDFAYDAQSALELVRHKPYGLAVLDHWPPYVDAFGLFRRLRLTAPTLRTVILSSGEVVDSPEASHNPGVARLLVRTADPESVLAVAREFVAAPAEIVAA